MNKPGTFIDGERMKEYAVKDIPAFSGKLLPEFDKRRNIKDMFGNKPSLQHAQSSLASESTDVPLKAQPEEAVKSDATRDPAIDTIKAVQGSIPQTPPGSQTQPSRTTSPEKKRKASETTPASSKRAKTNAKAINEKAIDKGQQSLKGFFASKSSAKPLALSGKPIKETNGIDAIAEANEKSKSSAFYNLIPILC